jgi:hypothetical protein
MMVQDIVVVIPVTEPTGLKDKLRELKAWLKPYKAAEMWTYEIPLNGDDYSIHVKFKPEFKDVAMHFRLACG